MQFDWTISEETIKKTWLSADFIVDYLKNNSIGEQEEAKIILNAFDKNSAFLTQYYTKSKNNIFLNEIIECDYNFLLSEKLLNYFIDYKEKNELLLSYLEHIVFIVSKKDDTIFEQKYFSNNFVNKSHRFFIDNPVTKNQQELINNLLEKHKKIRLNSLSAMTKDEYKNLKEDDWIRLLETARNTEEKQLLTSYHIPLHKIEKTENLVKILSIMFDIGITYREENILKNKKVREKISALSENNRIDILKKISTNSNYYTVSAELLNLKVIPLKIVEAHPDMLRMNLGRGKVINDIAKNYPKELMKILAENENSQLINASGYLPANFWKDNIHNERDAEKYSKYLAANFEVFDNKAIPDYFFTKEVVAKLLTGILSFIKKTEQIKKVLKDKSFALECLSRDSEIYKYSFFPKELASDYDVLSVIVRKNKKENFPKNIYNNLSFWIHHLKNNTIENPEFIEHLSDNVINSAEIGQLLMNKLDKKEIKIKHLPTSIRQYLLIYAQNINNYSDFFNAQLERQKLNEEIGASVKENKALKI